ncbi:MAG: DNA topoisomerase-1 [bacterium]|jgi:DNA topoisomerase-1
MSTLVIVESPTKAKTIQKFLPKNYVVLSSMGHIRDLPQSASEIPAKVKKEPWAQLGVNVRDGFDPLYLVPKDKKKVVAELKKALKDAEEVILATDEDREGESISWHLLEVLKPKVPAKRMVFHEITKEAIEEALTQCREIDTNLVHAQEVRRILDRLVGYSVSPLLWKKVKAGLSAGRVQSVSVRLLVLKERERRAFKQASYWGIKSVLSKDLSFQANLISVKGKRIATGKDFDENTGMVAEGKDVLVLREQEARELAGRLPANTWKVIAVDERPVKRKPSAPFTTSTLQQEANRKLRLSARDSMRFAQNLYEKGLITYMRTDSVSLSGQAIQASRECVEKMYGKDFLSPEARQFQTKSKNAQEAHEAIRPAGSTFILPAKTGLSGKELALYDLIWKRTVASQMAEARQTNISVQIEVEEAVFRSSGKRIDFPGFFRAYVEGSDDPDAAIEGKEIILPNLKVGDTVQCKELEPSEHETQPPARYTEASLVKMLEKQGIGRPSTYASIIGTIIDRGYSWKNGEALIPTFTAFAVVQLLEAHFPDLVDTSFTATMEQTLDEIAAGEKEWLPYLEGFFLGEKGLEEQVIKKTEEITPGEFRNLMFDGVEAKICIGKFGPYLEIKKEGEETITASLPKDVAPADLNAQMIETILRQKSKWNHELGIHPDTGEAIFLLSGSYGPYVQLGEAGEKGKKPKRVALPKGMKEQEVTFDVSVGLLSLPRFLGDHPESGSKIHAGLGPYGPYIVSSLDSDKDYRSLKSEDNVITIELERALEILAEPKKGKGSRGKAEPLRTLGEHPDDQVPVNIFNGPYGHYIKHNRVNAALPKGETIEEITLETAVELLAAKAKTKKTTRGTRTRKK